MACKVVRSKETIRRRGRQIMFISKEYGERRMGWVKRL
jgi:hypothetical protein